MFPWPAGGIPDSCAAAERRSLSLVGSSFPSGVTDMPAKSKAQQKAAGAALAVKRGDQSARKLKGASKEMAESMSEKELTEMASTKRKGKPERASKS